MTASLIFDDTLELCDPNGHVSGADYWFEALAEGASWGDPQPVEVAMASLIRDGALTVKTGDGNREAMFVVTVKGADQAALDAGVAALHRATGKRTTLLWTPPDGYGPPRIWDVETSNLLEANGFDDLAYFKRNEMVFRLRLVCLPNRRGVDLIVDDAGTPPSSGGVLLYNFESTTGWSYWGSSEGTPFVSRAVDTAIFSEGAGSLRSRAQIFYNPYVYGITYARNNDAVGGLSLDTGTGGYLAISIRTEHQGQYGSGDFQTGMSRLWMTVSGVGEVEVTTFVAASRTANGFVRYVWPVNEGLTVTSLRFEVEQYSAGSEATRPNAWYDDVELLPSATTDHQIVKQLEVQGSARTTGSLRVTAPSEDVALGQVLIATAPAADLPPGFLFNGQQWAIQGVATPDATALHGAYFTPDAATYSASSSAPAKPVFEIPVNMLTAGPYTMVGLVKAEASSLTFGVQAQFRIDGANVGPTSVAEVTPQGLSTGWQFIPVGTVYLPPLPMQGASDDAKVRLLFKGAKFADVYFIPAWQVNGQPVADFSIVDCGSGAIGPGGASSTLWIDSPSTSQPQGGWWRGPTQNRANARSAWPDAKKPGIHTFRPGPLTAFLVSTGAAGPTLTLEYFDRYL